MTLPDRRISVASSKLPMWRLFGITSPLTSTPGRCAFIRQSSGFTDAAQVFIRASPCLGIGVSISISSRDLAGPCFLGRAFIDGCFQVFFQ
jgi:hypothetical protein